MTEDPQLKYVRALWTAIVASPSHYIAGDVLLGAFNTLQAIHKRPVWQAKRFVPKARVVARQAGIGEYTQLRASSWLWVASTMQGDCAGSGKQLRGLWGAKFDRDALRNLLGDL